MLKNKCMTTLLSFLFLFAATSVHAQTVEGFYVFQGDSCGDFKGDTVILLSDGSAWKVHPDQKRAVPQWQVGDDVRVSIRNSHYYFKREHKFKLVNHALGGKSLKVMLVDYGHYPLYVVDASEPYATRIDWVPVKDDQGNIVDHTPVEADFQKDLILSDGTSCKINANLHCFNPGTFVYHGVYRNKVGFAHFLITGIERHAVWAYIF